MPLFRIIINHMRGLMKYAINAVVKNISYTQRDLTGLQFHLYDDFNNDDRQVNRLLSSAILNIYFAGLASYAGVSRTARKMLAALTVGQR